MSVRRPPLMLFPPQEEDIYYKETITKGFKGFHEDLSAYRGFKYEIGKVYEEDKKLIPCKSGFHFCKKLEDVNTHYCFSNESNRFCEIEAYGEIVDDNQGRKSVTSKIKIIRELSKKEIFEVANKEYWNIAKNLQTQNPNILIGGSMALIIAGLLPEERFFHDLDIVIPHYLTKLEGTSPLEETMSGSSVDLAFIDSTTGIKIDCFINPHAKVLIRKYNGVEYSINCPFNILQAKLKYCLVTDEFKTESKHYKDLVKVFTQTLSKKELINLAEDIPLPF